MIRIAPEKQKLDILFLCTGQKIFLWGYEDDRCFLADGIRILCCEERNYTTKETIKNGVLYDGDSADSGIDPGDPKL